MSLPERRKEADRKYRQAKVELKVWRERLRFRAGEWMKATRKHLDLPRSFTFSIPLAGDIPSEQHDLQALSTQLASLSPNSGTQESLLLEEVAFRKARLADLGRLMEAQSRVSNFEKQLMHLGDPVKDSGGYKIRLKVISASIFKRGNRRKVIQICILIGCIALGLYGLSFLFPGVVRWGDTVRVDYAIYTPELQLLEESPPSGVVYTLTQDLDPRLFFEGIVGRPEGSNFWIDIPACDTHDCPNYGGFTKGTFAWRELRINVTIVSIIESAS